MPSPQFEGFLQAMIAQRTDAAPSIAEMRAAGEVIAQMLPPPEGTEILAVDAGGVQAEWVAAAASASDKVVLYLHGGGYCIWSPAPYRNLNRRLADATGARVLAPDYRLAPEHPFPAAVDDAVASFRWLLAQGVDGSSIAIAGDSAGGGLTLALLIALRDAGDPMPSCAVVISPWADVTNSRDVSDDARSVDILREDQLALFADSYLAGADPKLPLVSPLFADLTGLPPLLVLAGEREILLDDAKRFADRAGSAGVDITLHVEPGMVHIWHMWDTIFPEAPQAVDRIARFMRSKLN